MWRWTFSSPKFYPNYFALNVKVLTIGDYIVIRCISNLSNIIIIKLVNKIINNKIGIGNIWTNLILKRWRWQTMHVTMCVTAVDPQKNIEEWSRSNIDHEYRLPRLLLRFKEPSTSGVVFGFIFIFNLKCGCSRTVSMLLLRRCELYILTHLWETEITDGCVARARQKKKNSFATKNSTL